MPRHDDGSIRSSAKERSRSPRSTFLTWQTGSCACSDGGEERLQQ